MERTLILLKPDAVQRQLVGPILTRFEQRGLKIVAMKLIQVPQALAEEHYAVHKGRPFYNGLIDYIISGPVVALVLEGPNGMVVLVFEVHLRSQDPAEPRIVVQWGLVYVVAYYPAGGVYVLQSWSFLHRFSPRV